MRRRVRRLPGVRALRRPPVDLTRPPRPTLQTWVALQGWWVVGTMTAPAVPGVVFAAVPLALLTATWARRWGLRRAPTVFTMLANSANFVLSGDGEKALVAGLMVATCAAMELLAGRDPTGEAAASG